ncbi:hypothetical protein ACIQOU_09210 [Streptomyces sp. NPDC091279]|uniref:hypothetical protein n=1 Tax=unclassified Streptomyces TaxID=2593676 RepID=UPI0038111EFA
MLRHIAERYARALCAAVVAVATLILASHAVPAAGATNEEQACGTAQHSHRPTR